MASMCVGGMFLRDPLVGSFLLLAGVLSFILGMLVSMLVGKRCVQPGCYGRVRQLHDIKEEDKIASKEKWTALSSINEFFLADVNVAAKYMHGETVLVIVTGEVVEATILTTNVFSFIPICLPVYSNTHLLAGVVSF